MKTKNVSLLLMVILALISIEPVKANIPPASDLLTPPVWEMLGRRTVNWGIDHDEIMVTASDGRFTAIKIMLKGGPVNMHRCVVHYGNGESNEINLQVVIPANGESRVIDLQGGERIINRISFWYDTRNRSPRKAAIEVWGRK